MGLGFGLESRLQVLGLGFRFWLKDSGLMDFWELGVSGGAGRGSSGLKAREHMKVAAKIFDVAGAARLELGE